MTSDSRISGLLYGKNGFRYHVIPAVFILAFTSIIQVLAIWGQGKSFTLSLALEKLKGDLTSWAVTLSFYLWAWLWIRISSKKHIGPETSFGYQPVYADNGTLYFWVTMTTFLVLQAVCPGLSLYLYDSFPEILGVSNSLALIMCAWLYIKGKYFKEHPKDIAEPAPVLYEFYRGMEIHTKVFGVDAKQFTNCRVGMMLWPIFLTAFFIVGCQKNGFNVPAFMHLVLQMVYIAKFYWWESGYFHTLDMMLDRAGYYLCWGCLVFLPAYFCFPMAYVVASPSSLSDCGAIIIGVSGLILTYIEYMVDQQKHDFRSTWPKEFKIGGKPAKFILAEYTDSKGQRKKSPLLTSGYWGVARHLNYALECFISFTISATLGFNNGVWTFAYFIFIFPLILHRILRDEAKCSNKYGKDWLRYKEKVKYVLIPGIY